MTLPFWGMKLQAERFWDLEAMIFLGQLHETVQGLDDREVSRLDAALNGALLRWLNSPSTKRPRYC